ncbi:hypothetical protein Lal_00042173 [Lupinus albus]|nr:hypothetical protein Lal_00042173 [Lupinus albus]
MEVDSDNVGSDENSGGISPPSDDGGNGGGNFEVGGSDDEGEQMHNDPYERCHCLGATRDGSRDDNEDYAPPRHSNMWSNIIVLSSGPGPHETDKCLAFESSWERHIVGAIAIAIIAMWSVTVAL